MQETRERKLHPIIEFIIITAVIFICNLFFSFAFSQLIVEKSFDEISSINAIFGWFNLIIPTISTLFCMKVIENRKTGIVKILIITICVTLFFTFVRTIAINFVGRYGMAALAAFTSVSAYISPIITAIPIVLFLNIPDTPKGEAQNYGNKIYCGLFKHIILLLFTFGIWLLIWIYRVTTYLNCVEGEEYRNPATKLLLCMFVPFYYIYWTYISAQRIDKLAKSADVISDLAVPCLIFEIFVPIIPPILMQDKINKIIETAVSE